MKTIDVVAIGILGLLIGIFIGTIIHTYSVQNAIEEKLLSMTINATPLSISKIRAGLAWNRKPTMEKKMKIKHLFEYVDGDFDTTGGELICVGNSKYGTVHLCFKEDSNITFAKIKLYSRDLAIDADAVYDDAVSLGNEIARRWNQCRNDEAKEQK